MPNDYRYPAMPQLYPFQNFVPMAQPTNDIKFIQGGDNTAKAYPVEPGKTAFLMDSEESIFYIKSVAYNGVPSPLRKFKYEEVFDTKEDIPVATEATKYVTIEEFNNAINDIKELIRNNKPNYTKRGDRNAKSDLRHDE